MGREIIRNKSFSDAMTFQNQRFENCAFLNCVDASNCDFVDCQFKIPENFVKPLNRIGFLTVMGFDFELTKNRFIGNLSVPSLSLVWIKSSQQAAIDRTIVRDTVGSAVWMPRIANKSYIPPTNGNTWFRTPHASNAEKDVVFGIMTRVFSKRILIRDNYFQDIQAAGLFVGCTDGFEVSNNHAVDCWDYGLGAEGVRNGVFSGNLVEWSRAADSKFPGWETREDWGGIAVMHYGEDVCICGNRTNSIRLNSQGNPILNVRIEDNSITDGNIVCFSDKPGGTYPVWMDNVLIKANRINGGIKLLNEWEAEPWCWPRFWLENNDLRYEKKHRMGIRLSGVSATVIENRVVGARSPFQDENQLLPSSNIVESGNLADGKPAVFARRTVK